MTKNKKVAGLLIYDDDQFEQVFKDAEKEGVERGLVLRSKCDMGTELNTLFNTVAKKGYFVSGFIIDGFNIEFLFQRHSNQSNENKITEVTIPEELKYKL